MERRGKSSPAWQVTACKCKPYPKQHRRYPEIFSCLPDRRIQVAWGGWRQSSQIDGSHVGFLTYRTRLTGAAMILGIIFEQKKRLFGAASFVCFSFFVWVFYGWYGGKYCFFAYVLGLLFLRLVWFKNKVFCVLCGRHLEGFAEAKPL